MHLLNSISYSLLVMIIFFFSCTESREKIDINLVSQEAPESDHYINLINKESDKQVDVWINGTLFTSYLFKDEFKKPILYPINTHLEDPVTRGFPLNPRSGESSDHPHQVGLWLNYGDVNGLDFWNHSDRIPEERRDSYGTIVHKEITNISSGDNQGELDVVMEWLGPDGDVLLVENTSFIFTGNDNDEAGSRTIDRITRLTAVDKDISLTDNKEGMIGLRVTRELEHPDEHEDATGMYRSSEGLEGHDVWGTRGRWMNLAGQINNGDVSVTIFDHPDNVGYPTYWHARGYGLFAANPLGMKEMSGGAEELNYQLEAGDSIMFKHRIVIRSGSGLNDDLIESKWEEWVSEY